MSYFHYYIFFEQNKNQEIGKVKKFKTMTTDVDMTTDNKAMKKKQPNQVVKFKVGFKGTFSKTDLLLDLLSSLYTRNSHIKK